MLNSIESFTGVGLAILKPPAAEDVENARSAFLKRQRQKRPRKKKKQDVVWRADYESYNRRWKKIEAKKR